MGSNPTPIQAAAEKTTLVTTRLDSLSARELARVAREADRTMSAELRRAVRFYLEHVAEAAA
jgi:hypothetical protein